MSTSGPPESTLSTKLDYAGAVIDIEHIPQSRQFDEYRTHACEKEPWTAAFIESIPPGGTFYDIGANVGSYSLVAMARGIRTIAFEPGSENYAMWYRNCRANAGFDERGICFPVALADANGMTSIDYGECWAGSANVVIGAPRKVGMHRQPITCNTLETLVQLYKLPHPTHVKIDVDGNELPVLKGFGALLDSPVLTNMIIEMQLKGESQIREFLGAHGWEMTARYDERNGQRIGNIAYGLFGRKVAVEPEKPIGRKNGHAPKAEALAAVAH